MSVDTVRSFAEKELYPHEAVVERTGAVPREIGQEIARKCLALGFFAANLPEDVGGGGLGHPAFTLLQRAPGRATMALPVFSGSTPGLPPACHRDQRERDNTEESLLGEGLVR